MDALKNALDALIVEATLLEERFEVSGREECSSAVRTPHRECAERGGPRERRARRFARVLKWRDAALRRSFTIDRYDDIVDEASAADAGGERHEQRAQ